MFKVPILLILYNRIEETHKVFQTLRTIQPMQLYVAGDGALPDNPLDTKRTYQTRSVVRPEWPCDLHTFWQDTHHGKSRMIDAAIRWFFSHENEGIILFEDTVPCSDFFPYCEELLEKYRNDKRIFTIGGNYFRHRSRQRYRKRLKAGQESYYFSAYATTWGFATWRDRLQDFTLSMDSYNSEDFPGIVTPYMHKRNQRKYWIRRFDSIKKYKATYWDYQLNLHVWTHKGLCISPYLNLVTNIGFQKRNQRKLRRLERNAYPILPLNHPTEVVQNHKADRYMFRHIYNRAYIELFQDWLREVLPNKNQ